jgi:hypothetical protein
VARDSTGKVLVTGGCHDEPVGVQKEDTQCLRCMVWDHFPAKLNWQAHNKRAKARNLEARSMPYQELKPVSSCCV